MTVGYPPAAGSIRRTLAPAATLGLASCGHPPTLSTPPADGKASTCLNEQGTKIDLLRRVAASNTEEEDTSPCCPFVQFSPRCCWWWRCAPDAPQDANANRSSHPWTIQAPRARGSASAPRGGPTAGDEYRAITETIGTAPSVVLWFVDFTAPPPIHELDIVRAWGADPIVTWEPWRWLGDGAYDRTAFAMADIASGVYDDHLYRWADELAAWGGGTVYLRFAHEPNGDWYPWSPRRRHVPRKHMSRRGDTCTSCSPPRT